MGLSRQHYRAKERRNIFITRVELGLNRWQVFNFMNNVELDNLELETPNAKMNNSTLLTTIDEL